MGCEVKIMYFTKGYLKFKEQDIFGEGCQPDTATTEFDEYYEFKSDNLEKLIQELMIFCKVTDKQDVLLDSCDEKGRVDIQRYETLKGRVATEKDLELWKEGKLDLYLTCFSFRVKQNNDVDLSSLKGYSRY